MGTGKESTKCWKGVAHTTGKLCCHDPSNINRRKSNTELHMQHGFKCMHTVQCMLTAPLASQTSQSAKVTDLDKGRSPPIPASVHAKIKSEALSSWLAVTGNTRVHTARFLCISPSKRNKGLSIRGFFVEDGQIQPRGAEKLSLTYHSVRSQTARAAPYRQTRVCQL